MGRAKGIAEAGVTATRRSKKDVIVDGFLSGRKEHRQNMNYYANLIRFSVIDGQELAPGEYEEIYEANGERELQRKSHLNDEERAVLALEPFQPFKEMLPALAYSAVTGQKLPDETAEETIARELDRWVYSPGSGGYAIYTANDPGYNKVPATAVFEKRQEKLEVYSGY